MKKHNRRIRLINPRLQWKFIVSFTCLGCAAVILEAVVINRILIRIAGELPYDGDQLLSEATGVLLWGLVITLLCLVPVSVGLGILATFRVAGPLYRIRTHMEQIARGENPGTCQIRKDEELQDVVDALNAAVETLRSSKPEADAAQRSEQDTVRLAS